MTQEPNPVRIIILGYSPAGSEGSKTKAAEGGSLQEDQ